MKLPTSTVELADWLRSIATQVDRIPDYPIVVDEKDVEVRFYYCDPLYPDLPTGIYFQVNIASTYLQNTPRSEPHKISEGGSKEAALYWANRNKLKPVK